MHFHLIIQLMNYRKHSEIEYEQFIILVFFTKNKILHTWLIQYMLMMALPEPLLSEILSTSVFQGRTIPVAGSISIMQSIENNYPSGRAQSSGGKIGK